MYFLTKELWFPDSNEASDEGILAIGGDLNPERIVLAYENGIFPWYNKEDPILWWSPPERMVLFPHELKISKSMRALLNKHLFISTIRNKKIQ